jgi:hypothetical protein
MNTESLTLLTLSAKPTVTRPLPPTGVNLTSTAHLWSVSRLYSLLTDRKSRARVSTIGSPVYGLLMVRE